MTYELHVNHEWRGGGWYEISEEEYLHWKASGNIPQSVWDQIMQIETELYDWEVTGDREVHDG